MTTANPGTSRAKTTPDSLASAEARAQIWLAAPERFGLAPSQAAAFAAAATAARAAADLARSTAAAAAHALAARDESLAYLRALSAEAIADIHAHALTQTSPASLCGQAMVPPIPLAAPKAAPTPGQPDQIAATTAPSGAVTLRWRCANPVGAQGTVYHIARRIGPSGPFTHLGSIGVRVFTDTSAPHPATIPPEGIQYIIQAQRGQALGPVSETFALLPTPEVIPDPIVETISATIPEVLTELKPLLEQAA